MTYTLYELTFYFFLYSFAGWCLETAFSMLHTRRFQNRGFLNGPICPVYGVSAVLIILGMNRLHGQPVFQFIGACVIATVVEYLSGALTTRLTGRRMWDYSGTYASLNGRVCLKYSLVWGALSMVVLWLVQPYVFLAGQLTRLGLAHIILWVLLGVMAVDFSATLAAAHGLRKQGFSQEVAAGLQEASASWGNRILRLLQRRLYSALPAPEAEAAEPKAAPVFAEGICADKLIWIFFLSGLLGDWIETVFVWASSGVLMSRSSLLYGTFSLVWALGGAIATAVLHPLRDKNDRYIFIGGFLMGGTYEYMCSVVTEVVFGTKFWDYSDMPFNLDGRINLLYCLFWGVAAILWLKALYPLASKLLGRLPLLTGRVLSGIIVVALVLDIGVSGIALGRYVRRAAGVPAQNTVQQFLDAQYPDSFIEWTYPNMTFV